MHCIAYMRLRPGPEPLNMKLLPAGGRAQKNRLPRLVQTQNSPIPCRWLPFFAAMQSLAPARGGAALSGRRGRLLVTAASRGDGTSKRGKQRKAELLEAVLKEQSGLGVLGTAMVGVARACWRGNHDPLPASV